MMVPEPLEAGPAAADCFDKLGDIHPSMAIHTHPKFLREMTQDSRHDAAKGIKLTVAHQEFSFCFAYRADISTEIPVFVTFS
jgi:hypothetical protein